MSRPERKAELRRQHDAEMARRAAERADLDLGFLGVVEALRAAGIDPDELLAYLDGLRRLP